MKKKLMAEFLGTYLLVFAGTGAVIVDEMTNSLTHVGISITFGLVVMALIYTFGHISGAHFNPAVTIGFFVHKDMERREMIYYIICQVVAGIMASLTLRGLFGNVAHLGATLPSGSWAQSFILEFILTFFLMMVILGSAIHGKAIKSFAGLAIGAAICVKALFAGPISGASMNPARSMGPALVSGGLQYIWIYIFATILGAVFATYMYQLLHEQE